MSIKQTGFVHLFILLLLIVGILIGLYLVQNPAIFKPQANYQITGYPVRVGMTYTHSSFAGCNTPSGGSEFGFTNTGLIYTYNRAGVRDTAKQQLATMHQSGIQTIGTVIWHMHEFSDAQQWGVIPSTTKRVEEPYRTNLINYLTDIKQAGFERILVTMGPQWKNSVGTHEGASAYDPTLFDENWQFLRDVRSIVKQYGPDSYFDILGEGAPPNPDEVRKEQMTNYDRQLWTNYVSEFGKEDAVISFIAPNPIHPTDADLWDSGAIDNLYAIFESSGKGQPNWYQFSFYPTQGTKARALQEFNYIDQKLEAKGYGGNLIIREGWYNNGEIADAIAEFNATHRRKITEVLSWYIAYYDGSGDPNVDKLHCPVSPPYDQGNFISKLPTASSFLPSPSVSTTPTPTPTPPPNTTTAPVIMPSSTPFTPAPTPTPEPTLPTVFRYIQGK